jgi:hypothetical protein
VQRDRHEAYPPASHRVRNFDRTQALDRKIKRLRIQTNSNGTQAFDFAAANATSLKIKRLRPL